jgi:hypothetical protein
VSFVVLVVLQVVKCLDAKYGRNSTSTEQSSHYHFDLPS